MSGDVVPVIVPNIRGITAWSPDAVIEFAVKRMREKKYKKDDIDRFASGAPDALRNFLDRIQRQSRNLGITGADRALNFAATAAYRVLEVISKVIPLKLELDEIKVVPSAVCRPGSECFDVDLKYFNPQDVRTPVFVFRFTVDVSDTVPVGIDKTVAAWTERPKDR